MAFGLPNWWHSILAVLVFATWQVRFCCRARLPVRQVVPLGPPPPPLPYSSFFNQTQPPLPDYYMIPSNHDRSTFHIPETYSEYVASPLRVSQLIPPREHDPSYPIPNTGNHVITHQPSAGIPKDYDEDLNGYVEYDSYWEKPRPASIITSVIQHVLKNYRSHEGPDENNPDPTIVTVSVHILAVASINVVRMEYTVDLYLRQQWVDPRLAWDRVPHLAHHKDYVLLTAQKHRLWLPDLFFRNGKRGYKHDMSVPNDLLRVHPNGSVLYSQKITMIFSCSMYLRHYPMDRQECLMNIGSYAYTIDELRFVWREDEPVTVAENMQLLEFDSPRSASTQDCTKNGTTSTGTYSCLLLTLPLQRLVGSYLVTTYIPEVLIVMVSWLGFWIDVRAVPARVSLGLLTLLGLLTEISSVGSQLPRVTYIKAIDVWIIACLLFVVAALAEFAAAYMLAPSESANVDQDQELHQLIRDVLSQTVGETHCCCCYTKSTNHKPVVTVRRSAAAAARRRRPMATAAVIDSTRDISSSVNECGLCKSVQPDCCTCPLCIHLQCPKAPKSGPIQPTRISSNSTVKSQTVRIPSADRKHIVICEPSSSPTLRRHSGGLKRIGVTDPSTCPFPIKSALKLNTAHQNPPNEVGCARKLHRTAPVTGHKKHIPIDYNNNNNNNNPTVSCSTPKRRQRLSLFTPRSLFRFTRLHCGVRKHPLHSKPGSTHVGRPVVASATRTPTTETYDSEVDAYSRFLFPACFLLFNCCYWLFYMIIVDDHSSPPS